MKIDKSLILKLEKLARLRLSDEERENIRTDLNNILEMVEKLDELDTENVTPLVHMTEKPNGMRQDEVKQIIDTQTALRNAPDKNEAHFKVPKVIDIQK